ncbi:hypothetical protein ACFRCI_19970 [Streptomyces sp. NPDC056638]
MGHVDGTHPSSSEAGPHPVLNGLVGALPDNWQHRMGRVVIEH